MLRIVPGGNSECLTSNPNENLEQSGPEVLKVMQVKASDQVVGAGALAGVIQPLCPHLRPGVPSPGGQWTCRIAIMVCLVELLAVRALCAPHSAATRATLSR